MPNRKVYDEGSYACFVTFSCYKRRTLLNPDICKRVVLGSLASQLKEQRATCVGFVIMPDHVHAVVWFPEENRISITMNKWKELSSRNIAKAYERNFTRYRSTLGDDRVVWQNRYYGFNIYSDKKLREKINYIHNNPVRAGLVKEACDWPWRSARFYYLGQGVGIPISWPP